MQLSSHHGDQTPAAVTLQDAGARLLLVGFLCGRSFALPVASVERIIPMAALTRLPGLPPGVAGVLNLRGAVLPVVDARPFLGLPTPAPRPDQRLVVLRAATRYLLWMDAVERIVSAESRYVDRVDSGGGPSLAPFVVRLDGEVIPVLSPEAMDPGPLVHTSVEAVS